VGLPKIQTDRLVGFNFCPTPGFETEVHHELVFANKVQQTPNECCAGLCPSKFRVGLPKIQTDRLVGLNFCSSPGVEPGCARAQRMANTKIHN